MARDVPFLDLEREFHRLGDEMLDAARDVLAGGRFILDHNVDAFEESFAGYVGTDHAIGVNSGSDALYLALCALDIGTGDEVILPSHTFISTADAVARVGAVPVFVDVDPETYTIDPERVEAAVTSDTAAMIPVHLYGHPAEMDALIEIADVNDIAIVEDASQAHGATYHGTPVGSFGSVACFSLYPTKNLGAYGDGGIVTTDDDELARRLRMLREYGSEERYQHEFVGVNSRLDELQAAMLQRKLRHLDELNQRRREIASRYDAELNGVNTPIERQRVSHVYHLYVVRTSERDRLQSHLEEHGIQTLIHYPTPVHRQGAYDEVGHREPLGVTDQIADEILSLPMFPWLRSEEIDQVIDVTNELTRE